MKRVFLGWQRPALIAAVDYLWNRYRATDGVWPLTDVVVVVPGSRAGRRIGELLAQHAANQRVAYFPPAVTTVGQLPERLYRAKRPFASQLIQQLVWTTALRTSPRADLQSFLSTVPADGDWHRWFELACVLWRQHGELAGDGLNFRDVAKHGVRLPQFDEIQRWQALANVQDRYLQILDGYGLWDRQTARLVALQQNECETDEQIVLLGAVDMTLTLREMLARVSQHVTALVYADQTWDDKFDSWGCVVPEAWQSARIPVDCRSIHQVESVSQQANRLVQLLGELPEPFASHEITVGVPDETIVPWILEKLSRFHLPARYGPGESLEATRPIRLLRGVADYLRDHRIATLIDLLRHPDVADRFRRAETSFDQAVDQLDAICREHMLTWIWELEDRQPGPLRFAAHSSRAMQSARNVLKLLHGWLQPLVSSTPSDSASTDAPANSPSPHRPGSGRDLRSDSGDSSGRDGNSAARPAMNRHPPRQQPGKPRQQPGKPRQQPGKPRQQPGKPRQQPGKWCSGMLKALQFIYGDRVVDPDDSAQRRTLHACQAISEACSQLEQIPAGLSPNVSPSEAILMVLERVTHQQTSALPDPQAIELLGWLELPLDDAPVCLVTQLNDGIVPTASTGDLFLPDSLRSLLGLDDNARRYARDAYALTTLAQSKKVLHLIAARRDRQGTPLMPSRLLLATDPERLIQRSLQLFGESPQPDTLMMEPFDPLNIDSPTAISRFSVPTPRAVRTFSGFVPAPEASETALNVTDFKIYLDCPYRFYLSRIQKLREVEPQSPELDGAAFGNRLHDTLEAFGNSSLRDSTDESAITEFLLATLNDLFRRHYGTRPRAVLQLQRAQMELRLRAFAAQQVQWRRRGWRILWAESTGQIVSWKPSGSQADQPPVALRGRIDRVDRNEIDGRVAVLDYKSSDLGYAPRKTHHRNASPKSPADWIDLQLPMYRHFAEELELGAPDDLALGYVTLPRSVDGCQFLLADWNCDELQLADQAAWNVVQRIRQGIFWPPSDSPKWSSSALDRICQVGVMDRNVPLDDQLPDDAAITQPAPAVDSSASKPIASDDIEH